MARIYPDALISHFDRLIDGMHLSTQAFYTSLEAAIAERRITGVSVSRVVWPEGGLLSPRRQYLQVSRDTHVFLVSAFPIGTSLFVSWWVGTSERGARVWLSNLPFVGWLFRRLIQPMTFYRLDSAYAFSQIMHKAVLDVVDAHTKLKGLRRLTGDERKPILRELFDR